MFAISTRKQIETTHLLSVFSLVIFDALKWGVFPLEKLYVEYYRVPLKKMFVFNFFGEFILLLNAGGRTDFHTAPASTETVRTTRDGDPRTATPNFTQLLSSDASCVLSSVLLHVHRDRKNY